jgi:hypothetical protein
VKPIKQAKLTEEYVYCCQLTVHRYTKQDTGMVNYQNTMEMRMQTRESTHWSTVICKIK